MKILSLMLLGAFLHTCLSQPDIVPIKSHKMITQGIDANSVNAIYDNNPDTIGSFYSTTPRFVEVEFDLGKNHLIDHVLIRMKRDSKMHDISLSVGNSFEGHGDLPYLCERPKETEELYRCVPICRTTTTPRSGIVARRFKMRLMVPSKWISIYDMEIFAAPTLVSDDISSNRIVLPLLCSSRSWLITNKSLPANETVPTSSQTDVFFEKPYIVTEVDVQFANTPPKNLEILLISGQNTTRSLSISLADCRSLKSVFTCSLAEKSFSSRLLRLLTPAVAKLFIRGKPVFYPKIEIKTSTNVKEKLRLSCEYSQCDRSVHSDCSPKAISEGHRVQCANKRLIRTPSGSDTGSYVIVNNGTVEKMWKSTKFSVDLVNDDTMIVSMPRSHQYFGQYRCACEIDDKMSTEITSEVTKLKETDFLEDLIFSTKVQYKLSDDENAAAHDVSNNIIYLAKATLQTSFLPVRITMHSLIPGNWINVTFPISDTGFDSSTTERSSPNSVKAFESIKESWSVATHKYVIDEMFPEFVHNKAISVSSQSSPMNLRQQDFFRMLDRDQVSITPSMWSTADDAVTTVYVLYANATEITMHHTEKSCNATSNSTVLATVTQDKCVFTDARVTCSKFHNAILMSFVDDRDWAKEVLIKLTTSDNTIVGELSIKSNITLNQDDVLLRPRYTTVSASQKDQNTTIVRVDVTVISKKIHDFIACGRVTVRTETAEGVGQKMILQKSSFYIDVEMRSKDVNLTVIVSVDGVKGKHMALLQITDPTTSTAKNLELQEDGDLIAQWYGVEGFAADVIESYELTTVSVTVACNNSTPTVLRIPKSQASGSSNRYQVPVAKINRKHLTKVHLSIQPVFVGNKRGHVAKIERLFNAIAPSEIRIGESVLSTERTITILPSQTDLACGVKDVKFTVIGINVAKPQWKAVSLGNMRFNIMNLLPGRTYELKAKVIYKHGPEDHLSRTYVIETADDVKIIGKSEVMTRINERVNISCMADIGPKDKFTKRVEWQRADRSPLPDGVKSEQSADHPNMASLIMESSLADNSGEYMCFAMPAARVGSKRVTIVVNDLLVSQTEKQVDFSKKSEEISVTCSSSARGENSLSWVDPLGSVIPEGESPMYSVKRHVSDQKVNEVLLKIKEVSLHTSGIYQCQRSIGNMKVKKGFQLYGSEKMEIQPLQSSSFFVGEKLKLRCSAEVAMKTQKVSWEPLVTQEGLVSVANMSYPIDAMKTTQDIEITNSVDIKKVTCKLSPSPRKDGKPLTKTYTISLLPKIVINGPKEVSEGSDVELTCLGYPTEKQMELEWIYFGKDKNSTGEIRNGTQPDMPMVADQPISLHLKLTSVEEAQAGRYECKFKESVRGGALKLGKSLSLAVKPIANPISIGNLKKGAQSMFAGTGLFGALILATLILSVHLRL